MYDYRAETWNVWNGSTENLNEVKSGRTSFGGLPKQQATFDVSYPQAQNDKAALPRLAGKVLRGAGIVGEVVDVGLTGTTVYNQLSVGDTKGAAITAAQFGGRFGGALAGAAYGAALGSVVPGVGTVIGGVVGGIGGAFGGEWIVDTSIAILTGNATAGIGSPQGYSGMQGGSSAQWAAQSTGAGVPGEPLNAPLPTDPQM